MAMLYPFIASEQGYSYAQAGKQLCGCSAEADRRIEREVSSGESGCWSAALAGDSRAAGTHMNDETGTEGVRRGVSELFTQGMGSLGIFRRPVRSFP